MTYRKNEVTPRKDEVTSRKDEVTPRKDEVTPRKIWVIFRNTAPNIPTFQSQAKKNTLRVTVSPIWQTWGLTTSNWTQL